MYCDYNDEFKQIDEEFKKLKSHIIEKVEPIEKCVSEHPIPSILVTAGISILVGVLIGRFIRK